MSYNISIIIPTFNAADRIGKLIQKLQSQTLKYQQIIIVDSSSKDGTAKIAKSLGVKVITIPKEEFDHGGTRALAGKEAMGNTLVYLTQDVLPVNKYTIENLIKAFFQDPKIGVAFGRQLPYPNARPFGAHLRLFNYPDKSYIRSIKDKDKCGIKTAFCSNSFAAYRRSVLEEIGWFKDGLIIAEDTYAAAKILLKGYKIAYVSDALVYHSHNYSVLEEFKRYFDIGVFHKQEDWLIKEFGKATEEGKRYLISELRFLIRNKHYQLLSEFLVRNALKFIGYKLGLNHEKLPKGWVKTLSLHKDWWNKQG